MRKTLFLASLLFAAVSASAQVVIPGTSGPTVIVPAGTKTSVAPGQCTGTDKIVGVTTTGALLCAADLTGYATIQDEGSGLPSRTILDMVGSGVSCVDGGSKTTCTISGGGGGGTPGGSSTQVQFNDAGAFGGDANFTWDKTNDVLSVSDILGIRFVDDVKFADIDAAESNCSTSACLILVRPGEAVSAFTRFTWDQTAAILDLRGDENDPFTNGIYLSPFKLVHRKTNAANAAFELYPSIRVLQFHDEGGDNASGGPKDTYFTYRGDLYAAGRGQHLSVSGVTFQYGEGDAIGVEGGVDHYGNCLEGGGECAEAGRFYVRQGQSVMTATVSSYQAAGRNIVYTGATNENTRGIGRVIVNTTAAKVYTTGSVTSVGTAAPPVVTGSGTSWSTQFGAGAHTDICFSQNDDDASFPGGTAKFVVPIRSIDSETSLTLDYDPQGADKAWPGDNNGSSYRIYKCAQIASINFAGGSFIHNNVGTTDWAATDTLEVPLGWAQFGVGLLVLVQDYIPTFLRNGLDITNTTAAQPLDRGIHLAGKASIGVLFDNTWECKANNTNCAAAGATTGIRFQNPPTWGVQYASTASGDNILFRLSDGGVQARQIYNSTNDEFRFDHTSVSANAISLFPAGGFIQVKRVTAPATGAANQGRIYYNTVDNALQFKGDGGQISNTVQPDAGAANNFLTAISASGVISKAQPSFANLSGTADPDQLGGGIAADDKVLIADSASAATWRAIPTCNTVTEKTFYNTATNTWTCETDAGGGGGGDNITVATVAATDPDFIDTATIDVTLDTVPAPDTIKWDVVANSINATHIDETADYSFAVLSGKQDRNNTAVDDDDCTGEQGLWWYDTTDSAFEFCNASSGAPAVLGGGASNSFSTIGTATADTSTDTLTLTDSLSIDLTTTNDPEDLTAAFTYTATLAGNPALGADQCVFAGEGQGGVLVCEGNVADTVEGLIQWDVSGGDRTLSLPNATDTLVGRDTTDTLTNKTLTAADNVVEADTGDSATAFFSAGQIEAARGGTGDDTSGTTGVPRIAAGNWTYDASLQHLSSTVSTTPTFNVADQIVFNMQSSPTAAGQFLISQNGGDPTGGSVLRVESTDTDLSSIVLIAQQLNSTAQANALQISRIQPAAGGQHDGYYFVLEGASRDGTAHTTQWRHWVDITSNAGASTYTIDSRIDAAAFANRLTVTDGGTLNATTLTESGAAVPNSTDHLGFFAATSSSQLRTLISDEGGTGALMFGLFPSMTDDLSCTGSQVVRRNAGDTAFECATLSGGAVSWDGITNPVGAQALTMGANTTTWTWDSASGTYRSTFSAAFSTGTQYRIDASGAFTGGVLVGIDQNTGNPTAGTLLEVSAADPDPILARFDRTGDSAGTIAIDSGSTAAHISALQLQDRGTAKWSVRKTASTSDFSIFDEAGGGNRFYAVAGGTGENQYLTGAADADHVFQEYNLAELVRIHGDGSGISIEGVTDNAFETKLAVTDPTADRTVTIPNADSTTVQSDAGAANNFLTAISAAGVISKAQPSFSNLSGQASDTQIADGAVDGGSGGEIADGTVDSNDLATANKTLSKSIVILNPTTTETNKVQLYWPAAVTLTRVACSTDVGTVTIQFDERAEATPNTAGTNSLTSSLVCDTDSQTTTSFSDSGIAIDVPHNLQITATASSPTVVRIHIKATVN